MSLSRSQGRVFEKGKRKLDPRDEFAVEAALQAKKPGDEVIAVVIGPEPDGDALRKAFAMGVDRGVHVVLDADGLVAAQALRSLGDAFYFGADCEVAWRVGGTIGTAPPRTPNAIAIMKAVKKPIERATPDATLQPVLRLRAEYLVDTEE